MTDENHDPMDLELAGHGSIGILRARTDAGREWIDENIDPEAMHALGGVVVEPRFAEAILNGAELDGLTVGLV